MFLRKYHFDCSKSYYLVTAYRAVANVAALFFVQGNFYFREPSLYSKKQSLTLTLFHPVPGYVLWKRKHRFLPSSHSNLFSFFPSLYTYVGNNSCLIRCWWEEKAHIFSSLLFLRIRCKMPRRAFPPIFFSFWQEWEGERGGKDIEREEEEERLSNFLTRCVGNNFFSFSPFVGSGLECSRVWNFGQFGQSRRGLRAGEWMLQYWTGL